jgi:hypothetical protein
MFKRMMIILAVVCLCSVAFIRDAKAGPPWPAAVYWEDDICVTSWMDKGGNFIEIYGDGIYKVHEFNNSVTLSCHDKVNFDEVATIEEVCALFPGVCDEHGAADNSGFPCWIYYDYVTYDSHFVMNPSGNWTLTCHFNENDLP